jgi:hypothetical protein
MSDYAEYYEYYKRTWEKALAELTSELQAENARLKEALEFYADLENWYISSENQNLEICNQDGEYIDNTNGALIPLQAHAILYFGGCRARKALKGGK